MKCVSLRARDTLNSRAERAVPVRVTHGIVRVTTRDARNAAVVQVAEAPSRTDTRSRRVAVEASFSDTIHPYILGFN